MWSRSICQLLLTLLIVKQCNGISSPITPFTTYQHSTELRANVSDLLWTVDDVKQEIIFELHIKTTGWIALGISPAGGMEGADIGVGWIDQTGKVHFQDRHATGRSKPVLDETTTNWLAIQGREQDGWTCIQFRRLLDTCDSMDVLIRSGSNYLIFAYGLVDPDQTNDDITYHETRRGSRVIPLQSYSDPPADTKFADLDSVAFHLDNYVIPAVDTTYHCKVYKTSFNFTTKRHAVAHKFLIDSANLDLVHHMIMYECDPLVMFDDDNLPNDVCDAISEQIILCATNIASAWAVGGDGILEYPEEAGYPLGGSSNIKYYMVQIHYDNPQLIPNRRDNSGIQFFIGNSIRQYDIGYLSFGTDASAYALAIPPRVDQFFIDSYCPANASRHFPESGITVFSAFPHTHLQGRSLWTKLIRNHTAVQYLFNAEAFNFNYQFDNRLPKMIKLYPGDEFATRCVYNTKNKNEITLGGERTKDEMCLHGFTYYPRMNGLYACLTYLELWAWQSVVNISTENFNHNTLKQSLRDIKWTPELAAEWQNFYDNAAHGVIYGGGIQFQSESFDTLPKYEDLKLPQCKNLPQYNSSANREKTFALLVFFSVLMKKIFIK